MRKYFFLLFIILWMAVSSQTTPKYDCSVPNATSVFGTNISVGNKVYDVNTQKLYLCITATASTYTLTTASANFRDLGDYRKLTNLPSFPDSIPKYATGLISVKHKNGSLSNYSLTTLSNVARGNILKTALSNVTSGDIIYLCSGVYDFGTYQVVFPDSITIFGNGKLNTIIKTLYTGSPSVSVSVATGDEFYDLTIDITSTTDGSYRLISPVGTNVSAKFYNCKLLGNSDIIYLNGNDYATFDFYYCDFWANYDVINIISTTGAILSLYQCNLNAVYNCNSWTGNAPKSRCVVISNTATDNCQINCYDCNLVAFNSNAGAGNCYGSYIMATGNRYNYITLSNCNVSASGTATSVADLYTTSTHSSITAINGRGSGVNGNYTTSSSGNIIFKGRSSVTDALNSQTKVINVSASTAPSTGQVLTAVDDSSATWQNIPDSNAVKMSNIVASVSGTPDSISKFNRTLKKMVQYKMPTIPAVLWNDVDGTFQPKSGYETVALKIQSMGGGGSKLVKVDNDGRFQDTTILNIPGNAATATKWTSPITINGVSIDGSTNITVTDATKVSPNTSVTLTVSNAILATTATIANGLAAGIYTVTVTQANNATTAASCTGSAAGLTTIPTWNQNTTGTATGTTTLWLLMPGTPVRTANTTFTITGDYTSLIAKGMIIKWTESSTVRCAMVSIPSTYGAPNTTVTVVGDVMASIDASSLKYCNLGAEPFMVKFAVAGTIGATGTDVANAYYATEPMRVLGADMQVGTAGTTNSTTCNVVNGTGTVTLCSPTLGSTVTYTATPQTTAASALSLALGDRVQINVTAIQTTAAIDLYIQLYLFPTRYLNF